MIKFHCNNKGRHFSDPGYKDICEKQCADCADQYPQHPQGKQEAQSAYDQRVRAIAEDMALADHSGGIWPPEADDKYKAWMTDCYLKAARIAVRHMSVMYQNGYLYNLDLSEDDAGYDHKIRHLEIIKQNLGLIPPPADHAPVESNPAPQPTGEQMKVSEMLKPHIHEHVEGFGAAVSPEIAEAIAIKYAGQQTAKLDAQIIKLRGEVEGWKSAAIQQTRALCDLAKELDSEIGSTTKDAEITELKTLIGKLEHSLRVAHNDANDTKVANDQFVKMLITQKDDVIVKLQRRISELEIERITRKDGGGNYL